MQAIKFPTTSKEWAILNMANFNGYKVILSQRRIVVDIPNPTKGEMTAIELEPRVLATRPKNVRRMDCRFEDVPGATAIPVSKGSMEWPALPPRPRRSVLCSPRRPWITENYL